MLDNIRLEFDFQTAWALHSPKRERVEIIACSFPLDCIVIHAVIIAFLQGRQPLIHVYYPIDCFFDMSNPPNHTNRFRLCRRIRNKTCESVKERTFHTGFSAAVRHVRWCSDWTMISFLTGQVMWISQDSRLLNHPVHTVVFSYFLMMQCNLHSVVKGKDRKRSV